MSLRQLLADGRLKPHRTNAREVRDLLRVVDRDLKDAAVRAISIDLRFRTAYQAALELATIVLAAFGYRTTGEGHHWTTFHVLPELLADPSAQALSDYFDQCRSKRNLSDYDRTGEITEDEAVELLKEARAFRQQVTAWLKGHHPALLGR